MIGNDSSIFVLYVYINYRFTIFENNSLLTCLCVWWDTGSFIFGVHYLQLGICVTYMQNVINFYYFHLIISANMLSLGGRSGSCWKKTAFVLLSSGQFYFSSVHCLHANVIIQTFKISHYTSNCSRRRYSNHHQDTVTSRHACTTTSRYLGKHTLLVLHWRTLLFFGVIDPAHFTETLTHTSTININWSIHSLTLLSSKFF